MPKRIYVGNLPGTVSRSQVQELFAKYGDVSSVTLSRDGTAVVEMSTGGDEAIAALNQTEMGGKSLNVNEAFKR